MVLTMVKARTKYSVLKRVYRQHHSLVVTLPMVVREGLEIKEGDYVEFSYKPGGKRLTLKKFPVGGKRNGRDKGDTGGVCKGKRVRVAGGGRR